MKRIGLFSIVLCLIFCFLFSFAVSAAPSSNMTLTMNYTNGGTVEVLVNGTKAEPGLDGKYFIPADAAISLRAEAFDDFSFDYWDIPSGYGVTENDQFKTEIHFVNPGEDFSVRAMFREHKSKYTVRINENEFGVGNFGHKDFAPGERVKVDATAYDGFRFVRWVDDNNALKNTGLSGEWQTLSAIEFIMPERDVDLSIEFDYIKYYFTVEIEGEGEIEVGGKEKNHAEKYECTYGEEILLSAVAQVDFVFVQWTATGGAILSDFDKEDTTLTCPASDFTVTANFASSVRTLTLEATPGGVTDPAGERVVGVESIINISAKADEGYKFSHWECSSEKGKFENEKEIETSFTMPEEDCTVKAVFVKGSYKFTLSASAGGTVEGEEGTYEMGKKIPVLATPYEGYVFSYWQCSETGVVLESTEAKTDIIVPGKDVEVTAVFVLESDLSLQEPDSSDSDESDFPWKTILVIFFISAVAITLVIVREYYNLSYRYLVKKGIKKLFGKK